MYRSPFLDPAPAQFIDQFEWDGGGYLYRHNRTGPLYRLTEEERDSMIVEVERRQRWVTGFMFAIFVGWGIALFLAPPFRHMPRTDWGLWANGFNLLMIFVIRPIIGYLLISRGLVRVLRYSTPIAPTMSKAERQRFAFDRMPLTVLVGVATAAFLLLLFFGLERPPIGPVGVALIVTSVAGLMWMAIQGTRKWMLVRADHMANSLI